MRARWTQRRAWIVWMLASFVAWAAIGALFTALLKEDSARTASDKEQPQVIDVAPASGPQTESAR